MVAWRPLHHTSNISQHKLLSFTLKYHVSEVSYDFRKPIACIDTTCSIIPYFQSTVSDLAYNT